MIYRHHGKATKRCHIGYESRRAGGDHGAGKCAHAMDRAEHVDAHDALPLRGGKFPGVADCFDTGIINQQPDVTEFFARYRRQLVER